MLRELCGDGWSGGYVHRRDNWSAYEQKSSSEGLHGKDKQISIIWSCCITQDACIISYVGWLTNFL